MNADQFKHAINLLGLTQEEAGKFLGYSGRQGQRFANEERAVPRAVAMLLRLMIKHEIDPKDLKRWT
jgi:hypothetical protein